MAEEHGKSAGVVRHEPAHHAQPAPTIWPATLAAGIGLLAAGIATNLLISLGGLVLVLLAIQGWVRELAGAPHDATEEAASGSGGEQHG